MRPFLLAAAIALSPAAASADSHAAAYDANTVLATVNGEAITLGHLIALQERLPDQYQSMDDGSLYTGMLEQLIDQTLIAQSLSTGPDADSKRVGLMLDNERAALLANLVVGDVAAAEVSDADVQSAYDTEYGGAEPAREINASHILVETAEEAMAIIAELNDGADFAEVAKAKSTGPSGPRGGELGWFGAGQMVPPFEAAAMALELGAISEPVQTQFGWHVIKLNETREVPPPSLEDVRAELTEQIRKIRVTETLDALRAAASVDRPETAIPPSAIRESELID